MELPHGLALVAAPIMRCRIAATTPAAERSLSACPLAGPASKEAAGAIARGFARDAGVEDSQVRLARLEKASGAALTLSLLCSSRDAAAAIHAWASVQRTVALDAVPGVPTCTVSSAGSLVGREASLRAAAARAFPVRGAGTSDGADAITAAWDAEAPGRRPDTLVLLSAPALMLQPGGALAVRPGPEGHVPADSPVAEIMSALGDVVSVCLRPASGADEGSDGGAVRFRLPFPARDASSAIRVDVAARFATASAALRAARSLAGSRLVRSGAAADADVLSGPGGFGLAWETGGFFTSGAVEERGRKEEERARAEDAEARATARRREAATSGLGASLGDAVAACGRARAVVSAVGRCRSDDRLVKFGSGELRAAFDACREDLAATAARTLEAARALSLVGREASLPRWVIAEAAGARAGGAAGDGGRGADDGSDGDDDDDSAAPVTAPASWEAPRDDAAAASVARRASDDVRRESARLSRSAARVEQEAEQDARDAAEDYRRGCAKRTVASLDGLAEDAREAVEAAGTRSLGAAEAADVLAAAARLPAQQAAAPAGAAAEEPSSSSGAAAPAAPLRPRREEDGLLDDVASDTDSDEDDDGRPGAASGGAAEALDAVSAAASRGRSAPRPSDAAALAREEWSRWTAAERAADDAVARVEAGARRGAIPKGLFRLRVRGGGDDSGPRAGAVTEADFEAAREAAAERIRAARGQLEAAADAVADGVGAAEAVADAADAALAMVERGRRHPPGAEAMLATAAAELRAVARAVLAGRRDVSRAALCADACSAASALAAALASTDKARRSAGAAGAASADLEARLEGACDDVSDACATLRGGGADGSEPEWPMAELARARAAARAAKEWYRLSGAQATLCSASAAAPDGSAHAGASSRVSAAYSSFLAAASAPLVGEATAPGFCPSVAQAALDADASIAQGGEEDTAWRGARRAEAAEALERAEEAGRVAAAAIEDLPSPHDRDARVAAGTLGGVVTDCRAALEAADVAHAALPARMSDVAEAAVAVCESAGRACGGDVGAADGLPGLLRGAEAAMDACERAEDSAHRASRSLRRLVAQCRAGVEDVEGAVRRAARLAAGATAARVEELEREEARLRGSGAVPAPRGAAWAGDGAAGAEGRWTAPPRRPVFGTHGSMLGRYASAWGRDPLGEAAAAEAEGAGGPAGGWRGNRFGASTAAALAKLAAVRRAAQDKRDAARRRLSPVWLAAPAAGGGVSEHRSEAEARAAAEAEASSSSSSSGAAVAVAEVRPVRVRGCVRVAAPAGEAAAGTGAGPDAPGVVFDRTEAGTAAARGGVAAVSERAAKSVRVRVHVRGRGGVGGAMDPREGRPQEREEPEAGGSRGRLVMPGAVGASLPSDISFRAPSGQAAPAAGDAGPGVGEGGARGPGEEARLVERELELRLRLKRRRQQRQKRARGEGHSADEETDPLSFVAASKRGRGASGDDDGPDAAAWASNALAGSGGDDDRE